MRKLIFSLILIILFCCFASAENRIFAGAFNETAFEITPITPAYESVEAYAQGNSDFSIKFYPSHIQYYVSENNTYSEDEVNYFYFIADVPEKTNKIEFYNNKLLYELNTNGEINLDNFNIIYENNSVGFSWNTSLSRYYASIFYNKSGMWIPLFFESNFNNSYSSDISLEWFFYSGYYKFKMIVSDGYNEAEDYAWFNIPYIGWCNGTDFNHDNVVDASDYITLKNNFGVYNATNSMGDADLDGYVGWADLQLLQKNIGKVNCSQAIFPEIPAQLLAESIAESQAAQESSSSSSGSSSSSSGAVTSNEKTNPSQLPITSNVIKENIENNEIKLTSSNKKGIFSKAIEALKIVLEFLIRR